MTSSDHQDIGPALGRIPSGLFIVTTCDEHGDPMGFLASFVQQMAMEPPTVAIAVSTERDHLAAIRAKGRFAVCILGEGDKGLMKPFFKKPEDGSPFDDVATTTLDSGLAILEDSLAWIECRLAGEHSAGDHVVCFGVVESGQRRRDEEPLTHTRKNGLRYS